MVTTMVAIAVFMLLRIRVNAGAGSWAELAQGLEASVSNAKAYLALVEREGSFSRFLWSFVGGKPKKNRRRSLKEVPNTSPESDAMSKALQKAGFKFVGSTICYAFMQASGMVDDHVVGCHRHKA